MVWCHIALRSLSSLYLFIFFFRGFFVFFVCDIWVAGCILCCACRIQCVAVLHNRNRFSYVPVDGRHTLYVRADSSFKKKKKIAF